MGASLYVIRPDATTFRGSRVETGPCGDLTRWNDGWTVRSQSHNNAGVEAHRIQSYSID